MPKPQGKPAHAPINRRTVTLSNAEIIALNDALERIAGSTYAGKLTWRIALLLRLLRPMREALVEALKNPEAFEKARIALCEEHAEKIVDLGNGTHGRAGILIGGFLFDGDHWRQACDLINVWPLHIPDELARIGPKSLHITALPLGINRIKSHRTFPASTDPRDHHQLVLGNGNINILQVVHPRTEDLYELTHNVKLANSY